PKPISHPAEPLTERILPQLHHHRTIFRERPIEPVDLFDTLAMHIERDRRREGELVAYPAINRHKRLASQRERRLHDTALRPWSLRSIALNPQNLAVVEERGIERHRFLRPALEHQERRDLL